MEGTSESLEGFVKTQIARAHPQSFSVSRFGEMLMLLVHGHILRITGIEKSDGGMGAVSGRMAKKGF